MSEPQSEADKIRNKRLAKLGGQQSSSSPGSPSASESSTPATPTPKAEASTAATAPSTTPSTSSPPPGQNPFAQLGLKSDSVEQQQPRRITIKPAASAAQPSIPQKRDSDDAVRPRSRLANTDSLETWEDRTLSSIFRVTLRSEATTDAHGHKLHYLADVAEELQADDSPMLLKVANLDQAILDAATNLPEGKPLDYLLGCWKRIARLHRQQVSNGSKDDPKLQILTETKRICMSYCMFTVTAPELFGLDPSSNNALARHLLIDQDKENGICHDFLVEAVARFAEDDGIRDALVGAVEQLSNELAVMSMNDNYKPYIMALRNISAYPALADALTKSPKFLVSAQAPQKLEFDTLLGPFFAISPMQGPVALNYFQNRGSGNDSYVKTSQKALRMTLQTHQDDLFNIVNSMMTKSGKEAREKMLDWFALVVNANHKRRAMYVDLKTVSTDGFMVNVTVILDRLCEPFMDATFSKVDRIDADHLRRSPRVQIQEETKINADQSASEKFYSQKAEGQSNFISEIFFLTAAAHHVGLEAADSKMSELQRQIKHLEKQIEKFEKERHQYAHNPVALQHFDNALKKYKDQVEQGHCIIHATRGVLLDEVTQARSMQFMRYVIVWLIRLVSPDYPKNPPKLPLPAAQPELFGCLPEYFIEDVIDNFKFITRNIPQIITSTQCEELMHFCITFLRSSEYIKNPGLKMGICSILYHGTWPIYGRPKGVLGDILNGSPFAFEHLMHTLLKIFIEVESTGTHTQFYDKFNSRWEIFHVIRCIWSNSIYRENLATESKVNNEFFVRFVNLLTNDVTYVLDEVFSGFISIRSITEELKHPPEDWTTEKRQEKEEALEAAKNKAKGYMDLANETVSMLALFTDALSDAFTEPEVVTRLADMLDYNLDSLVGKQKQKQLKVENPQEYHFVPQNLVSDLVTIYLNLGQKQPFVQAIARDLRSYRPENFDQAKNVMEKFALKSPEELDRWMALGVRVAEQRQVDIEAEDDFGEIPEEFEDPLLSTLMEDPVILPISRTVIDRSTIRGHLLSDPTDPFNRTPLKIEDVIPNTELKERIEQWKQERRDEALRRRETAAAAAASAQDGDVMDTS